MTLQIEMQLSLVILVHTDGSRPFREVVHYRPLCVAGQFLRVQQLHHVLEQRHSFVLGKYAVLLLEPVVNDVVAVLSDSEALLSVRQVEIGHVVLVQHVERPVLLLWVADRGLFPRSEIILIQVLRLL